MSVTLLDPRRPRSKRIAPLLNHLCDRALGSLALMRSSYKKSEEQHWAYPGVSTRWRDQAIVRASVSRLGMGKLAPAAGNCGGWTRPDGGMASAWGTAGASPEQGEIQFLRWVTHPSLCWGSNSELNAFAWSLSRGWLFKWVAIIIIILTILIFQETQHADSCSQISSGITIRKINLHLNFPLNSLCNLGEVILMKECSFSPT